MFHTFLNSTQESQTNFQIINQSQVFKRKLSTNNSSAYMIKIEVLKIRSVQNISQFL